VGRQILKPSYSCHSPGCSGLLSVALLVALAGGCGADDTCRKAGDGVARIVLTFDDGPLPADVDLATTTLSDEELLAPLSAILATLEARGLRGVFFVEGPGSAEAGAEMLNAFAQGLAMIHRSGHVLGYHGFAQDTRIWAPPLSLPVSTPLAMRRDLDELERYLDAALARVNLTRAEAFASLFRQPFGGLGSSAIQGFLESQRRGWTYRGYLIDSLDWTGNIEVDPALISGLPVATGADHSAYVRERLRAGAARHADRAVVDVLFHVNHFTAARLDAFLDTLAAAFAEQTAARVEFSVPDCYLQTSSLAVDRTFLLELR
jgi:peptidoglycan/xylan/chitin deacetylase (PgdA/CDA1 family)